MVTGVRCAKTAEPIEMQCGMWTSGVQETTHEVEGPGSIRDILNVFRYRVGLGKMRPLAVTLL